MATVTPAPVATTNADVILSDLATGSVLESPVCIGVVESTEAYNPALVPHSRVICPSDFPLVTTAQLTGCCGGLATEISGTIACCPCGAFCTGDAAPSMVEWSDGQNGIIFPDWTMTTGSSMDGGFGFDTTAVVDSPTVDETALPTSTTSMGSMSPVAPGMLIHHFMLFLPLWNCM